MLAALCAALAMVVSALTERSTALPVATAVWCVLVGLVGVIAAVVRVLERPEHAELAVRRRRGSRSPAPSRSCGRLARAARRTPLALHARRARAAPAALSAHAQAIDGHRALQDRARRRELCNYGCKLRPWRPACARRIHHRHGGSCNELRHQPSASLRSDHRAAARSPSSSSCSSSSGTASAPTSARSAVSTSTSARPAGRRFTNSRWIWLITIIVALAAVAIARRRAEVREPGAARAWSSQASARSRRC